MSARRNEGVCNLKHNFAERQCYALFVKWTDCVLFINLIPYQSAAIGYCTLGKSYESPRHLCRSLQPRSGQNWGGKPMDLEAVSAAIEKSEVPS